MIHTAGPVWKNGLFKEEECLASCYRNSLYLAKQYHCSSIAFPLISTGNYGFPKPRALQIAIEQIHDFLLKYEMRVYLVVFEKESYVLSEKLYQSIKSYIDENYIQEKSFEEYEACKSTHWCSSLWKIYNIENDYGKATE